MEKRSENRTFEFETFRLDAASFMLYQDGREVSMPPKAVETLLALVERSGDIIPKDDLMKIIWSDSIVEESNLSQYLHLLRKTLGKTIDGKPFIETLRRRGYRFNGLVTVADSGFAVEKTNENVDNRAPYNQEPAGALRNERRYRVERHGNVLALAQWPDGEEYPAPKENLIDQSDSLAHDIGTRRTFRPYLMAVALLTAILLATAIFWGRSDADPTNTLAKGDLTFVNLTNGEDVDCATISPDGNYFVYTSNDGELSHLWLQQTGQPNAREIISPITGNVCGTTFTTDSKFVYFVASEKSGLQNSLYRVPALGGVHEKLFSDIDSAVSFSPDGMEMVFVRSDHESGQSSVMVASSDGTGQRALFTRSGGDAAYNAEWSSDGKRIAYSEIRVAETDGKCTIAALDLQTYETRIISKEKWDNCFRMAWTRDSRGLILIGTKFKEASTTRRDQVYYISIGDGESRRLTTDGSRHQSASLGITDKDELLTVPFNRLSQIWGMDADGDSRTAKQVTRGFADGRSGIAPLASGVVAYLTRNGDGFSIWRMNRDGSERKQITTNPTEIEELRSDQQGRFFIFSAKEGGRSHLYRVDADGGSLTPLTFGNGLEIDSTISPDGNWIVYDSKTFNNGYGRFSLWRIPSAGGEASRVGDLDCSTPHFSPDGKFLSCVAAEQKKIFILSADSGKPLASAKATENAVLNVGSRWTPDGKAVTFIERNKNVGNIWLYEIDASEPRPLTDFTSGEIYNYAFSIDGSQLFVARGYPTRNAVLIKNFR